MLFPQLGPINTSFFDILSQKGLVMQDIIGRQYGKWTIVEFSGRDGKSNKLYLCRCLCGSEKIQRLDTLSSGESTQCKKCRMIAHNRQVDLAGTYIGDSFVIERISNKNDEAYYLVRCGCGREKTALAYRLKKGESARCAHCRVKTHGATYTRTFKIWRDMIARCTNPNLKAYKYYGAKGITVFEEWLKFENFLRDMGECPDNLTIDRIDASLGYNKQNCRWLSKSENSRRANDHRRK
jgi:predicted SprT family Zn-dependent metalloprotease